MDESHRLQKPDSDRNQLPKAELMKWLLSGEPWTAYRALTDLLDKDEPDTEVAIARKAIPEHPLMKRIFGSLNKEGYWGKPKDIHTWWPRKNTTFWILPVLADFSFTTEDKRITKAASTY